MPSSLNGIVFFGTLMLVLVIGMLMCTPCAAAVEDEQYAKLSPFEAVRFRDDQVLVRVDGRWYELFEIDGLAVPVIMQFCERTYGDLARKRFKEDLVEVMTRMRHQPGETVDLSVRQLAVQKLITLKNVRMTMANRQQIVAADRRKESQLRQRTISRTKAAADIEALRAALQEQYSYLTLHDVDYNGALDALRDNLPDKVRVSELATGLQKVLALFGDGHTRVTDSSDWLATGYLPFHVEIADDRVVAFDPVDEALLRPDAPYIVSIDGIEISRWLDAAGTLVADGSPAFQRHGAVQRLLFLGWLRDELGLPQSDDVTVQLGGRMSMGLETITLPVADEPISLRQPVLTSYSETDDLIGVLRIPTFSTRLSPDHVDRIIRGMNRAERATGLIVDVRGNGGGNRRALRYLLPYLMQPDEAPVVVNTAKYRLNAKFDDNQLASRYLHRADALHWTDEEREAIAAFARTFSPQWNPPAEQFSDWHYMVVRQSAHPHVYHFDRPVVILMDRGCFSATDIFLGAFKGRPGVTLMGTPSGGGSGKTESVQLPNSRLRIALSSMASFRPDGRLYDGNGIEPDVLIERTASDVIGKTDTQMDAALKLLREQTATK